MAAEMTGLAQLELDTRIDAIGSLQLMSILGAIRRETGVRGPRDTMEGTRSTVSDLFFKLQAKRSQDL